MIVVINMQKTIILNDEVKNTDGQVFAKMRTVLNGDGATPNVMTMGVGPIGFSDDGKPIIAQQNEDLLKEKQQEMMATAIKEQKALCVENGVDPDLVNIINAERKCRK